MTDMKAKQSPKEEYDDTNLDDESTNQNMLPTIRSAMAVGQSAGEVDQSDLRIPFLSITYGVGKLSQTFNPGDLILGGEHFLVKKSEPLTIVILSDVKYFKEVLSRDDWADGKRPRTFMTRQEVLDAGGTLEWRDDPETGKRIKPTFGPALDMKILIQCPEGLDDAMFGLEIEGGRYAPAYFSVDKSAYNRVGKAIQTSKSLSLARTGILGGIWELHTESQVINDNPTIVPMIKLVGRTTDEFRTRITELFGA